MANGIKKDCCCVGGCRCTSCWGADFGKKLLLTLAGVLLVYGIFYLGTLVRNNIKQYDYIGKADKMERTLTINGFGKVTGNNDIAVTTIGYSNTNKDVATAQANNKVVMDKVFAELKTLGVADKDLQTNYTVYPDYNYTQDKGQQLNGYRVSNQVTVKIRDLAKINQVLNLAGKYGATEVSGLNFTIDDPENLKTQARDKALADAKVKAVKLAQSLGVRLGGVVYYNEYEGGQDMAKSYMMGAAEGGGMMAPAAVASGSKDVSMNVSINFEILPISQW
ncbi:MAG: SIMPL domain-containing protein [Candidatus Magasanikbacteria bacterium]|jgi:hypothetical protein